MGTNFYLKRIPNIETVRKAHEMLNEIINSCDFSCWEIEQFLNKEGGSIHLGKRSYGWQFHWQTHDDLYQQNLKSIIEFLYKEANNGATILNEYGEEFTVYEFINQEIGESMYAHYDDKNDRHYYNSETYYKDHPDERGPYFDPTFEWTSEDGLRFSSRDFS